MTPGLKTAAQQHWTMTFEDERDFCRFASLLIGAVYQSGANAIERFDSESLWGEKTHGKVSAALTASSAAGQGEALKYQIESMMNLEAAPASAFHGHVLVVSVDSVHAVLGPSPANVEPAAEAAGWISVHDRMPEPGAECLVWIVRNPFAKEPFLFIDTWDVLREDPLGLGGPTIETGLGWGDNEFEDISHWMPLPAAPGAAPVANGLTAGAAEGEARGGQTLWLWQNGDHFLAFEHLYPCITPGGDPMTLGEPFGRAVFMTSFNREGKTNDRQRDYRQGARDSADADLQRRHATGGSEAHAVGAGAPFGHAQHQTAQQARRDFGNNGAWAVAIPDGARTPGVLAAQGAIAGVVIGAAPSMAGKTEINADDVVQAWQEAAGVVIGPTGRVTVDYPALQQLVFAALSAAQEQETAAWSRDDLDRVRQWYDSVADTNRSYLDIEDHKLAVRVYRALDMRPSSMLMRGASGEQP